jgi:hypothetical protein
VSIAQPLRVLRIANFRRAVLSEQFSFWKQLSAKARILTIR